jgi:hypothetical protein
MIQAMATVCVALSVLSPPAIQPLAADPTVEPPEQQIAIDLVTVNGSGCPPEETAIAVSEDNTAFTVTYHQYRAQVGGGARPVERRRNCQLVANVLVPNGFTYAIIKADYRGFASLAEGATGWEQANYYFQGHSRTTEVRHSIVGPYEDDWQTTDETEVKERVWAPCGAKRFLNVNTSLRVDAGGSDLSETTSYLDMESTDVDFSTMYHLAWKKCDES